jgi:GntR family transcriptional regulator
MEQGISFERVIQEITAVLANPIYAGLLQTDIGAPLVKVSGRLYDQTRRPRPAFDFARIALSQPYGDGHIG